MFLESSTSGTLERCCNNPIHSVFYGNDITAEIGSPTDAAILAPFITTRFPLIALISQLLTCKCYVISGLWGIHRERPNAASRRHQRRRTRARRARRAAEAINKTTITFQYLREQMSYIALKGKKNLCDVFFFFWIMEENQNPNVIRAYDNQNRQNAHWCHLRMSAF